MSATASYPPRVRRGVEPTPAIVRGSLGRQLAEGEIIHIQTKPHLAVLSRQILAFVGACLLWMWVVVDVKADNVARFLDWVVLGTFLWLLWAAIDRYFTWFVVTDKRILKHEGILIRKIPMMRLTKVTDLTYKRSLPGLVLGYGTIVIESAGQQQAIRELRYIRQPEWVSAKLNATLFGEKPRERKDRERSWKRWLGRGDGGWPTDGGPDGPFDDGPFDGGDDGGPYRGPRDGSGGAAPTRPGDVPRTDQGPPPGVTIYTSSGHGWHRGDTGAIPRSRARDEDTTEIPVLRTPQQQARHRAEQRRRATERAARAADERASDLYPPRDWVDHPEGRDGRDGSGA